MGTTRRKASEPKDNRRAPTAFESRLYKACQCIPKGKVATYGMLAKLLGSAPRAVGQGMKRNPYAPVVPCHRVIASDRRLGGFHGAWGDDSVEVIRKRKMLVEEGVDLDGSLVQTNCIVELPELEDIYHNAPDFSPCHTKL